MAQGWMRQSFGFELRVHRVENAWECEVILPGQIFRDTIPDLDTALIETCRRARQLAGKPPIEDADTCDDMDGWRPYMHVDRI
jgi:hypothetical protein